MSLNDVTQDREHWGSLLELLPTRPILDKRLILLNRSKTQISPEPDNMQIQINSLFKIMLTPGNVTDILYIHPLLVKNMLGMVSKLTFTGQYHHQTPYHLLPY